ncbi:MAG: ribokinase [Planctomycetes bacterium]|nr:ribokinase [Planctomycetota bacterium]MBL7037697.1 ribokinase [Pirellulaceae bacterium]
MNTPRIVVVGSSNTDMVVKSDRLPAAGETVTGGQFVMAPGGKGANQAVAAARLGAEVTFVAKVGADMFGDQAVEGYKQDGILTDLILRDSELHTGVALILVDGAGENLISVASGANHALTPGDLDTAVERIRSASVLMLQLECPLDTVTHAAQIAAEAGVAVVFDPAPAPDGPLDAELLRNITFLTPNETEATRLTGVQVTDENSAQAAAERLLAAGASHVIVTLGSKGALVAGPGESILVSGHTVEAADSTAAGDAFNGGLAAGLAGGMSLPDAVAQANRVGALSVTRLGAQPSLPTADEVRRFAEFC